MLKNKNKNKDNDKDKDKKNGDFEKSETVADSPKPRDPLALIYKTSGRPATPGTSE